MVTKIRLVKALVRHNGRYLLLKKARDKYFPENIGKWECSGGMIEEGETSRKTILREVKRETGLEIKIVKKLPTLRMIDKAYDSKCDVYLIDVNSEEVSISDEHTEYRWVRANGVKEIPLVLYANLLLEFFNNEGKYLN
ncbi:MAG: NUDIX domain-containing protein [Nanoarchaeota archaeon]